MNNQKSLDLAVPNLIFISMQDWEDIWRRNQFVCAELARRHPGMKILFVNTSCNAWHLLARFDLASLLGLPRIAAPGYPNITITQCPKVGPDRYWWGTWLNRVITRRHVRKLAARLGLNRPVLWLNPHTAVHMIGNMDESSVVYDVTDDWISFQRNARLTEQVRGQDRELCEKADAVIVCSERLQEIKQELAKGKLHLIPNGVDAGHYRAVLEGTGPLPPTAASWPKPVFGYTGTIHPDRVDVPLVEAVAKHLTRGTMVFVGPNHFPTAVRQRLMATGRIVFHEPVPYEAIPQYMRAFDVCMTPHRISAFVESLQPIKLWEYLAAGKPIVATKVAGFRDYPHLVRLADNAEQFAEQLAAAAAEGPSLAEQRQAVARDNSWHSRVDAIERVLGGLSAPPKESGAGKDQTSPMSDAKPTLSVIVVSYNTRQMTLRCLQTLHANLGEVAAEVVVVDNGSHDESTAAIGREYPQVHVIANNENAGFGAANNRAMQAARGKYLLLLNSDAFVEEGAVAALIEFLERHPRVGAVGPKLSNADGSLQISCFPFPSPLRAWAENLWLPKVLPHTSRLGDYRKWAHDQERMVEWVVGACMLVRRETYEAVGGFDERFFMYSEEADWQRRMRNKGWQIAFTPAARVMHLGGASGAGNSAGINRHFFESLDRYELKHHGWFGLLMLRLAMIIGCSARALGWAICCVIGVRRRVAWAKLKLRLWLIWRQATHWSIPGAKC